MKIHEYQAKGLLAAHGVPVPRGQAAFSVDEAVRAAESLGGSLWVVKAQIHAGGRGKGGGVKLARSLDEVRQRAGEILGMRLVTHQTGPEGKTVRRLLVEEGIRIAREFYVGVVIDRATQNVAVMASPAGGMEIEAVARETPEQIHTLLVDPLEGLAPDRALAFAAESEFPAEVRQQAADTIRALFAAFLAADASLLEVNPLVVTEDGRVLAADAKANFDDNALFRHPDIAAMRDLTEEDPRETRAAAAGLSYIQLDGDIGCLVNGAGLAMATMDTIKLFGGEPANFLDVGGSATSEKVTEAFRIMLESDHLKAILVNIFGGIMHCDTIAQGVVDACRAIALPVPLVVRMHGTNEALGKRILAESALPIIAADTMDEAARKAVAASRGEIA